MHHPRGNVSDPRVETCRCLPCRQHKPRIDYFLVSDRIAERVQEADILSDVFGSDHCPVALTIEL